MEGLTVERASEMLAERRAAGPSTRKKAAPKKAAAKKAAAKKKAPAKRAPAKKKAAAGQSSVVKRGAPLPSTASGRDEDPPF